MQPVFYDEQPVSLRIALRQRIRWAKGHLQAFAETGWPLWKHVFTSHDAPTAFMSYDMFLLVCPRALWSIFTYAARLLCALALWLFTKESFAWSARRCWRGPPASESAGCGTRSSRSMSF